MTIEEKAKEYCPDDAYPFGPNIINKEVREAFIAGAKWQKQHDAELIEIAYNDGITIGMAKQKEQKPELVQQPPITYTYNSNASRDERLKAALLALLNSDLIKVKEGGYFTKQDLIEWVERIPTDKPAEWSEVELEFRGEKVTVKRPFYRDDKGRGYSTTEQDEDVAWNALRAWCEKKGISLYDLYPKAEWSEEDADILNCCISSIEEAKENRYAYKETDGDTSYDREIDWLKSLRPRHSWKPSEEQMNGLETAIVRCQMTGLESLYEDLKKLM